MATPGPVVVAPTHRSNLDVPIIGSLSRRRLRYLTKRSMFKGGVITWFLSANGAFPVDRGTADREALAIAQRQLEAEETRMRIGLSTTFQVLEFQETLAEAKSTEVTARAAYAKARIKLTQSEGGLANGAPDAEAPDADQ